MPPREDCSTWRGSQRKLRLNIDAVSIAEVAQSPRLIAPGAAPSSSRSSRVSRTTFRSSAATASALQQVVWNLLANSGEVHRERRHDPFGACAGRPNVRLSVARHRAGHRAGLRALRVRSVPPGGRVSEPASRWRAWGWPWSARSSSSTRGGRRREPRRSAGSTFWVDAASGALGPSVADPRGVGRTGHAQGCGHPVVDDETDARELRWRCSRITCARPPVDSAAAALEILDGDGFLPDVMVSDVGMPGTTASRSFREIRSRPSRGSGHCPPFGDGYANPEDRVGRSCGLPEPCPEPVDANVARGVRLPKLVAH